MLVVKLRGGFMDPDRVAETGADLRVVLVPLDLSKRVLDVSEAQIDVVRTAILRRVKLVRRHLLYARVQLIYAPSAAP